MAKLRSATRAGSDSRRDKVRARIPPPIALPLQVGVDAHPHSGPQPSWRMQMPARRNQIHSAKCILASGARELPTRAVAGMGPDSLAPQQLNLPEPMDGRLRYALSRDRRCCSGVNSFSAMVRA
jgi:hypothetical protein